LKKWKVPKHAGFGAFFNAMNKVLTP